MARGGRRAGRPGVAYGERTDLNATKKLPIQAPTGLPYGQAQAQQDAQRQLPIAPPPSPPVGAGPNLIPTGPAPGELTPLHAPTALPSEPVTAGLPIGAGPGPGSSGPLPGTPGDVDSQLRALYARFPSEDLRKLIEDNGAPHV